jgi:hypothetical protein
MTHRILLGVVMLALSVPATAQMGMPDARSMSGIPRQVDDLPVGTVAVLVVKGDITNPLKGHPVELHVGETRRTAKTDDTGHAQFGGLAPGATVRAIATIDGEVVQSQVFSLPDRGGVRLVLAGTGTAAAGADASAPPIAGSVTFGGESRIIVEFDEDALQVYYLLDVVNTARAPVNPPSPLVIDMPAGATDTTVLEGSSPQAVVKGARATISGPFAPGTTSVQLACRLPVTGSRLSFSQKLPATFEQLAVMVQKVGELRVQSKQLADLREMPAEGRTYVAAVGPSLAAGSPFTLDLTGLPHRSTMPTFIALVLAVLVLAAGAWGAIGRGTKAGAGRRELEGRREEVFGAIVRLEAQSQDGRIGPDQYRARRLELMAQLERIYGELDTAGGQGEEGQIA